MSYTINKVPNANVYVEGASYLGKADEVTLPEPKFKQTDHSPLGTFGTSQYPSGLDPMDAKIKWNSVYKDAKKKFANPFKAIKVQLRFPIENWSGGDKVGTVAGVAYMTVRPSNIPGVTFKSKENPELESSLVVTYYKLEIDGEEIYEIDVEANIYKVNGVDLLADYRAAMGI